MSAIIQKRYTTFAEFYPVYLTEHTNRICRELHFVGSTLALVCMATALLTGNGWWVLGGLLCAYGFATIGHVWFEKNQPASSRQTVYAFMGNWVMYWQMLTGQTSF